MMPSPPPAAARFPRFAVEDSGSWPSAAQIPPLSWRSTAAGSGGRAIAVLLLAILLSPAQALAHASDRGHVLLLPTGHYLIGGATAVAASFLALVFLRPTVVERLAAWRLRLFCVGDGPVALTSMVSFVFLLLLVIAGFFGSRDPLSNPLPLVIWTLVWVGLTLVQGLAGNIWRWVNPWYFPWLLMSRRLYAGRSVLPASWGCWPAFGMFAAFAWFELIYPAPDDPARLALAVAIYWLIALVGMLVYGFEAWSERGEFLSAFYRMIARFAVLGREAADDGATAQAPRQVSAALPGARIVDAAVLPLSGVGFLLLALSSVSFDGLSKTFLWLGANGINPLEFPGRTAMVGINTLGLAATFAALSAVYAAAVLLGARLAGGGSPRRAAGLFVWSIVPIALAYHFSHYLTALLVNAQYALVALSDPFAIGWDLFGIAGADVHAGIAAGSQAAWWLWNLQAGAIISGHVLAVLIAHGLAYRLHGDTRKAALSQLPLTVLMIAYTVFGLWLLSTPTAG